MLPARQSCYSVFTCPTQRVLISRWMPARCSRPDNLTFFCLYLSNTVSLDRWTPARCSRPDNLTFSVFTCPTQQVLVSRWMPARCSRPDNLTFPVFTCPTQQVLISRWMPARCSRPDNLTFPVFTCPTRESQSPVGRRRGAPGQTNAPPSARTKNIEPRRTRHTRRFGNLSFQSTTSEVRPPSSQVSISRQMPQEPPVWTNSPFPPSSAKLTHQTGGHAHQLDVG